MRLYRANLVIGSSNSDDGTYRTDKERSALRLKFLQSKPISLATFSLVEISANTEMRLLIFVINSASKCVVHVEMRVPMGLAVS